MKIWASKETLESALAYVSAKYADNIIWNRSPELRGRAYICTLRADSSRKLGARRSWSGRRSVAACWHVHRDFMQSIFDKEPGARILTAMADYNGIQQFNDKHGATAHRNIGSIMQPCTMGDTCDCY